MSKPWQDKMQALIRGEVPAPPIARLIGFTLVEAGPGQAVFEMDAEKRHSNPMGTLHGGVLCDIGDAAMGFAMATTLDPGESFTTLELKINFFKPIWNAHLRAEARMVRRSRSIGYLECDITDEKGSLVARLGSTCTVLRGTDADGR